MVGVVPVGFVMNALANDPRRTGGSDKIQVLDLAFAASSVQIRVVLIDTQHFL